MVAYFVVVVVVETAEEEAVEELFVEPTLRTREGTIHPVERIEINLRYNKLCERDFRKIMRFDCNDGNYIGHGYNNNKTTNRQHHNSLRD